MTCTRPESRWRPFQSRCSTPQAITRPLPRRWYDLTLRRRERTGWEP